MNVHTRRWRPGLREGSRLFFQLNVWLALASVLMVIATAMTLDASVMSVGAGLVLPAALVYFVYIRERRQLPAEDRINHPGRTRLVERYEVPLAVTEWAALVAFEAILLTSLPVLEPMGLVLYGLAHLPIGALYYYPTLKGTPGLDSLAVAAAWAYLIVFTVVAFAGLAVSPAVGAVFLGWTLIVFAGVESRNLQDVRGDGELGKETLALRLGSRGTKSLEWGLKGAGVGVFWYVGDVWVALLVTGYLLYLRGCRYLTDTWHDGPA